MRRIFVIVLLVSTACGHAASTSRVTLAATPEMHTVDAHAWLLLSDVLCHEAHGVEYGVALSEIVDMPAIERVTSHDVSFELAREVFFDANDDKLRAEAPALIERIAKVFRALPKAASLLVSLTIEDEARKSPPAKRTELLARRGEAITTVLVAAGIDRARITMKSTIELWEGDYDGPSNLDPAEGRVAFAVVR